MNPKDLVGAKKAPLRYVPSALVIGVSEAMFIGQAKYGPFNWRLQPVSAMTYAEAIQRHLAAWVDGQENAEDTGVHHLKHIGASVAILLDAFGIEGGLLDDRPTKGPAADLLRELDRSEVPVEWVLKGPEAPTPEQQAKWIGEFNKADVAPLPDSSTASGIAAQARAHLTYVADGYCQGCGQPKIGYAHLITCPAYGSE